MPKIVDDRVKAIKRANPNIKDSTAWAIAYTQIKQEKARRKNG